MNTEKELRSRSEAKLHSSILRAEATNVVPVVPHHYFAASSSEIRDMFIDGYFIGTISLSQSVAEGLSKFLCKRKHLPCPKDHLARVKKLLSESIITPVKYFYGFLHRTQPGTPVGYVTEPLSLIVIQTRTEGFSSPYIVPSR